LDLDFFFEVVVALVNNEIKNEGIIGLVGNEIEIIIRKNNGGEM
jgi:hypothetical protein